MKKIFASGIIFTALMVASDFSFLAVQAQTVDLGDLMISTFRTRVRAAETSRNVTVIRKEEISSLPAGNLAEALKYVAGVDVSVRSGLGQPVSLGIQGSDPRQVRVMVDGIPLNSQVSEQVDPNWLPLENVEKIEVIKGAASSIWGSSLGGVINIITKDPAKAEKFSGKAKITVSEFRTRKEFFDFSGKAGDLGYYVMTEYGESAGRDARSDVLEKKIFSRLSYDLQDGASLKAAFGYSGADVHSGIYPDGTWAGQPYQVSYGKLGWQKDTDSGEVNVELKHSRKKLVSHTYLSETDRDPFITVRSKDSGYQLSLSSSVSVRETDLLSAGADLDWNTIKSDLYLAKAEKVNAQAGFARYILKTGSVDYNFGLRYDHNSEFGSELSPSLGAVYYFDHDHQTVFRAGVSRAFNAPLLLWRYNTNPLYKVIPNPELGPERAWVWETGVETKPAENWQVKLSLYRADVSDAIAWAENGAGDQYKKNFEKFRRQGIELETGLDLNQNFSLFAAAGFNDIEDKTTGQTVKGAGSPRQSFDLGINYKNFSGLSVALKGYYDRWNEPASAQSNDRKMLFDLHLSQQYKQYSFFFNIYNLTNSAYWSDYYFPVPERYFEAGVSFNW